MNIDYFLLSERSAMRSLSSLIVVAALVAAVSFPSTGSAAVSKQDQVKGLAKVCKKVTGFGYHVLYKFSASGHLATTNRANSCSLIYGPGASAPSANSLPLYDSSGKKLNTFRNYARNGFYKARFYTYGASCGSVAAAAKKRTKSSAGYIGVGKGLCLKVKTLYGRQGAAY